MLGRLRGYKMKINLKSEGTIDIDNYEKPKNTEGIMEIFNRLKDYTFSTQKLVDIFTDNNMTQKEAKKAMFWLMLSGKAYSLGKKMIAKVE